MTIDTIARRATALAAGALLLTSLVGPAGPATASPTATGCPGGYTTQQVSDLDTAGYGTLFLDGVDGNDDGVVCTKPLSDRQVEKFCATHVCTVTILAFTDNTAGRF